MKRRQQEFSGFIESAGGSAEKKAFNMFGQRGMAWVIDLSNANISDDLIDRLGELDYIADLNFSNSTITNEQLLKLNTKNPNNASNPINTTINLDLSGTAITGASLEKLDNFIGLLSLKLTGSEVTKDDVERFKANRQKNERIATPFKNPKIAL